MSAGELGWRAQARFDLILASLPARPPLGRLPAELARRLTAAEGEAHHRAQALGALGELATLYHANGFLAEAGQCYQTLVQADPANPRWPHRLAGIYAGYGELAAAIPLWQRTLRLDPDYTPARLRLGDALLKSNRAAEAAAAYTAVLHADATNPYALTGLARLDLQAGQPARACERLEAAGQKTDYAIGGDLLATVYEQLGEKDRAIALRARGKSSGAYFDPPDAWTDEMFFDCYDTFRLTVAAGVAEHGGDIPDSRRLLERALEFSPDDGHALLQLGLLCLRVQDYPSARRYLEQASRVAPQLSDVWAQLVVLYSTTGELAAAAQALASGLGHCPDSPGLRMEHARSLAASGRLADASVEYRASFGLRPDEAAPLIEIAKIDFKLGRMDEAVAELHHALAVEPEHPVALTTLAFFSIGTNDEGAARHWLERARRQARVAPEVIVQLSDRFTRQFGHAPDLK